MNLKTYSKLNVVELSSIPIFQQLQWEEALLRADSQNWCLLNKGSPPAIVMGISGKIEKLICQKTFERKPIPLIRRFSGGGTVVVDEETLFITLIFQTNDLSIAPFPKTIMQWTAGLYHPIFTDHAFRLEENDYVIGEKKWGGNAQAIIKDRWLHHSSLLWNYTPSLMEYLLIPPTMPSYRQNRSHDDFLCCLKDYWPDQKTFQLQFIEQLQKNFILVKKTQEDLERIAALPHRKVSQLL